MARTRRGGSGREGTRAGLTAWALWGVPRSALALILATEAVAIATTGALLLIESPRPADLGRFALLLGLSTVFTEVTARVERLREYLGDERVWVDSASVWSIAGAVTLPAGWAALLVVAHYVHCVVQARHDQSARPHRLIFTGATIALATLATSGTIRGLLVLGSPIPEGPRFLIAVTVAIISFQLVNLGLVCAGMFLVIRPDDWRSLRPDSDGVMLETVTNVLGVLTGGIVLHLPWLTPGVFPVLALLYRGGMVTQLQVESTIDAKTGILNFNAWRDMSQRALLRTERAHQPIAVLLIDLDHFKRVNDTYGHLVGDEVLVAVADCIKSSMREYDVVGRFGGEEFVLLLENADLYAAVAAATRLRESIAELVIGSNSIKITTSVGVAHSATSNATLDALLERADVALYEAKNAGRNTVRALAAFGAQPHDSVA